ncbi:sulfatase [Glaciecola sp. 4H-3-7+YE-5]|nr:sulfatase [Glaciecola sp. 4H-3-7+YE-5]
MKQAFFLSCALPRALRFLLERVSFIVSVTLLNLSLAQASTADEEIAGLSNVAEQNGTLQHSPTSEAPNILLVVADDLGMFDIGAFGSEIRTPNIDALADNGVSFNSFYTSATCSPTRAMLLTGSDSHAAGLGNMVEHLADNQRGKPGYEGHISPNAVTIATLMKEAGYHTYMAGKWHLGKAPAFLPDRQGFEESFVLLQGGASYFNDMMGLTSQVPKALYRHNGKPVESLPEDFYATEYYADFILQQLNKNQDDDKPFFAYLAFSAPHWPLQVRDEHLNLYRGQYEKGYDILREKRIASAIKQGIIGPNVTPANRDNYMLSWSQLSKEQQKIQAKSMEIYAAVVERMDFQLGRVLTSLRESGELENTVVIFMSDNGADGSDRSKLEGNDTWLPQAWDLSYQNMGKKGSYVYPGAGWARASVGPFQHYKEFLSEGGIRSPAIISFPEVAHKKQMVSDVVSVKDLAPTILDFAGIDHPGHEYQGRAVRPMTGSSIEGFLKGNVASIKQDERVLGWELFGQKAIRKGDWKLLWLSSKPAWLAAPQNSESWRLYNIANDPGEQHDLVSSEPEKFAEMRDAWEQYAIEQSVVLPQWVRAVSD